MDVQLKSTGCVGQLGCLLSLGVLPLVLRSHEKQFPASLTEDAFILRNGTSIAWSSFSRFKATDILLNGKYQHTLYELWHPGGRIHFPSHRIVDAEAVVKYMVSHLPPGIVEGKES